MKKALSLSKSASKAKRLRSQSKKSKGRARLLSFIKYVVATVVLVAPIVVVKHFQVDESCVGCGQVKYVDFHVPEEQPEPEVSLSEVLRAQFELSNIEDENKRLVVQRDARVRLAHVQADFVELDKDFSCVITYAPKANNLKVDRCNGDAIARRHVQLAIKDVKLLSLFERAQFSSESDISVAIGTELAIH